MDKRFKGLLFIFVLMLSGICGLQNTANAEIEDIADFISTLDEEYVQTEVAVAYEETSAKRKIKVTESPASITVITKDDIANSWATNIPDLLRNVVGVDVIGVYIGTHMVSIRGSNPFESLKVGVLIDGQVIEPFLYGTNSWNQIPVNINDIERIEVVRSPGEVLYGANASYGVVNIITKKPGEKKVTTLTGSVGEFDTVTSGITTSGKSGKFGYRAGVSYVKSDRDYPKESNTLKVSDYLDRVGDEHTVANVLANYETDGGKVEATYANNNYDYWNRIPDRLCETHNTGDISYGRIKYEKELAEEAKFDISLDYDKSTFKLIDNRGTDGPFPARYVPEFDKTTTTLLMQYSTSIGASNHILTGIEGKNELVDDKGQNKFFRDDIDEYLYAFWLVDEIKLMDNLSVHLGARVSDHYLINTSVSPSLIVVYAPVEKQAIRISATRAVREPNVYETEMDFKLPIGNSIKIGEYKGNEEVSEEINNAYEIAYRLYGDKANFELTLFQYDGKEFLVHDQVGNTTLDGVYIPVYEFDNYNEKVVTNGVETGIDWNITEKFNTFLNITWQEVDITSTSDVSPNGRSGEQYAPEYKANFGFDYSPYKWLRTNININYVDEVIWERPEWFSSTGNEEVLLAEQEAYTLLNLNLAIIPAEYFRVDFKVYNVTDEEHMEWPIISSSYVPRNASLHVKVNF
ncbi:MAG: hypothetical protein ACD_79C01131G0003 [uncultured bacterium]|nr:MAG: hypothetical protein ACD_79C01131G0003 [uncultured bacterium]